MPNTGSRPASGPAPETQPKLEIRRTFAAPRQTVYDAWSRREKLEQWMCRDVPSHRVSYLEFDFRTGGLYEMQVNDNATGAEYLGYGVYREVTPPSRLVFTWAWKKKDPDGTLVETDSETQVTVDFRERGDSTEVTLTHEFLPTPESWNAHKKGWEGCFDALQAAL
jgi:uncharacterized protein YndB with AHSA1/START domain